jgi:hypothetical protein
MIYKDGRIRDSVLFSIIKSEWRGVRDKLMTMLGCGEDSIGISFM